MEIELVLECFWFNAMNCLECQTDYHFINYKLFLFKVDSDTINSLERHYFKLAMRTQSTIFTKEVIKSK